jgi:hypothetical protein
MQFRRSGHSDERRRRVLREDLVGDDGESAGEDSDERSRGGRKRPAEDDGQRYSAAALVSRQPPVTCLIPKRVSSLVILGLLGLTAIAGVELLYTNVYQTCPREHRAALSAFDVNASGSLAAWLGSLLLSLTAAASLMVYKIRRHRLDDYRGRYRIWFWAALAFLVISIDVTAGLHAGVSHFLTQVSGTCLYGDGSLWWILILGVIFALGLIELAVEMRRCPAAWMALAVAAGGYLTAACLRTRIPALDCEMLAVMLQSGGVLLGHLSLAFAVVCYARYVYRDAQGELPRKQTAEDASEPAVGGRRAEGRKVTRASGSRSLRVDTAHASADNRGDQAAEDAVDAEEEPSPGDGKRLSKSERRRLRKQARRGGRS